MGYRRKHGVRRIDDEELMTMSIHELAEHERELNGGLNEVDFEMLDLTEARDDLITRYYSERMHLHSECQGGDFNPMHPNETEEEFFEHEDFD